MSKSKISTEAKIHDAERNVVGAARWVRDVFPESDLRILDARFAAVRDLVHAVEELDELERKASRGGK